MMNQIFRKILPHLIVIASFFCVTAVYFYPAFSGYKLKQGDITNFRGMSQEISEFRRMYGEEPLWTNSMFGGMPAYQISVIYPNNVLTKIDAILTLGLPSPVKYFFLYMAGFYLLMLAFRLRPGLAAVAAVAFALSSYYLIIIEAGHNSKAHAIGYLAPMLAGIVWTYRGKLLTGAAVTALFAALQIHANHVQITYYFGILLAFYALAKGIEAVQKKEVPQFVKASLILAGVGAIGVLANANLLWSTYEYSKHTTRGKTELTINPDGTSNQDNVTAGLDRDYVTQWSYGKGETFSFVIPNAKGGGSGALIDDHTQRQNPQLYNEIARGYQATQVFPNTYWGNQPFTSGPVYMGALVVLLFLLGAFFVKGPVKWALVATAILTTMLSWGHNFMGLTNFFLDYVPGYNKFRAVTIILAITELVFPLLGFWFLKKVLDNPTLITEQKKKFYAVAGGFAALLLLFLAIPETFFSFLSENEAAAFNAAVQGDGGAQVIAYADTLTDLRISNFRADTLRSLVFILLGIGLLWAFVNKKIKPNIAIIGVAVLVGVDMWMVDKRYLHNEKERGKFVKWQTKEADISAYKAAAVDLDILNSEMDLNPRLEDEIQAAVANYQSTVKAQKRRASADEINDVKFAALRFNTDFRVLPLQGTFQDARTAYFHKSVGGYHGAKLKRIQEIYDFHIVEEMMSLIGTLQSQSSQSAVQRAFSDLPVINMLNTKYIIYNNDAPPLENSYANGSAWFVEDLRVVNSADEEIQALGDLDTRTEAVVDERFAPLISNFEFEDAPHAAIAVETHLPNYIAYMFDSPVPQATVFSEIYYPEGWNAYIDGNRVEHFRVNYLLRGLIIPEGEHIIEFKFEPQNFARANVVSTLFSVIVLLLLAGSAYVHRGAFQKKEAEANG